MTSSEIRQSFLDFFREKGHTIVPSSSLLPDAPNLLFTNAGMNQFVPIFLGKAPCPYKPGRAADTQKCIRAGGKHNDLEDVGFDTYHHTFFEMLGNWSFGDYFKREAIEWAWELVAGRWKFPPRRLYATVYRPGPGEPAEADEEARAIWAEIFRKAGLDPAVHVVDGGKKDNFWMMGDTGPCGPCSELHVSLLPEADEAAGRELVNQGDAQCIEIWNLVFIQFNADGRGGFAPLPARHVDTGMGFERVASIIQGTRNFQDFRGGRVSNYETDIFRPVFDELERLTGRSYGSTLPEGGTHTDFGKLSERQRTDIAFRVIADHIRTLSFAIADGIMPSNEGRGYTLRRILRRAVRYGREIGFEGPFLGRLVPCLAATMGDVFPEIRARREEIERVLRGEEESFFNTLERGIALFNEVVAGLDKGKRVFPGEEAFRLYDTYGFPVDLTEVMARERGLYVDLETFKQLMDEQRQQAKAAQKKEVIEVETGEGGGLATRFVGYDRLEGEARVLLVQDDLLVVDETPFYAEMGGQVGDTGEVEVGCGLLRIVDTRKAADGTVVHKLARPLETAPEEAVGLKVDKPRRSRIEAHHSGTHLLHWALRTVVGKHVSQKGSYVGPDRLRFDFSHGAALTPEQLREVEGLVNERVGAADPVLWDERPYAEVKGDPTILQFFGDKYGDRVRVVSIGDYSKELCAGTHVRETGSVGFFKVLSEGAIAAGIRRIEAVSGQAVVDFVRGELIRQEEAHSILRKRQVDIESLKTVPAQGSPGDIWRNFAKRQAQLEELEERVRELEKQEAKRREAQRASWADAEAARLMASTRDVRGIRLLCGRLDDADAADLQALAGALKKRQWSGVAVLAGADGGKASLLASVSPDLTAKVKAGDLIKALAPLVGGKGGGRPDLAQGGGPDAGQVDAALAKVESLLPR